MIMTGPDLSEFVAGKMAPNPKWVHISLAKFRNDL